MTSARRYPRTARVNEAVLEVLADELERMSDPRLDMVTLTGVEVTRDLSRAKVYFSTLAAQAAHGDADAADHAAAGLGAAAPHLRAVLGRQLHIRQVPKLVFEPDAGIIAGQRIEDILHGRRRPGGGDDEDES